MSRRRAGCSCVLFACLSMCRPAGRFCAGAGGQCVLPVRCSRLCLFRHFLRWCCFRVYERASLCLFLRLRGSGRAFCAVGDALVGFVRFRGMAVRFRANSVFGSGRCCGAGLFLGTLAGGRCLVSWVFWRCSGARVLRSGGYAIALQSLCNCFAVASGRAVLCDSARGCGFLRGCGRAVLGRISRGRCVWGRFSDPLVRVSLLFLRFGAKKEGGRRFGVHPAFRGVRFLWSWCWSGSAGAVVGYDVVKFCCCVGWVLHLECASDCAFFLRADGQVCGALTCESCSFLRVFDVHVGLSVSCWREGYLPFLAGDRFGHFFALSSKALKSWCAVLLACSSASFARLRAISACCFSCCALLFCLALSACSFKIAVRVLLFSSA